MNTITAMKNLEREYFKRRMKSKLGSSVKEEELDKFLLMFGTMHDVAEELDGVSRETFQPK